MEKQQTRQVTVRAKALRFVSEEKQAKELREMVGCEVREVRSGREGGPW